MARNLAEQSNAFPVSWLRKNGFLQKDLSFISGNISWSWGLSEAKNSIGFSVKKKDWGTPEESASIELRYTNTDSPAGEKEDMLYTIKLTKTPCHLGGYRYWFICPLYKNGIYCGKRAGVLYGVGKWFGCRSCGNIAYQSQLEGGRYRTGSICEPDVERAYEKVKKRYYRGRITRSYKRYLKLRAKMDHSWIIASKKFGVNF